VQSCPRACEDSTLKGEFRAGLADMKSIWIAALTMLLSLGGCVSYQPVPMKDEQLHQELARGNVLRAGDRARLVLVDGTVRDVRVTAVYPERLETSTGQVALGDIQTIQTRKADLLRTTLLVGGIVIGSSLIIYALADFPATF